MATDQTFLFYFYAYGRDEVPAPPGPFNALFVAWPAAIWQAAAMKTQKMNVWKVLAWVSLLAALWFAFTLVLIMIRGGEWSEVITVNNPKKRMAAVALGFAGWIFLRGGSPFRDWLPNTGRLVLLGISVSLGVLVGEIALRMMLERNQGGPDAGSQFEKLAELSRHRRINLQSFHPLAAIVRLSTNRRIIYELMPDLDMEFGHRSLRTNRQGMRESRDYEEEKAPGVFRVVGIGDSGMFGWNIDQGGDYLAVLEDRLAEREGPLRYEILNLAVPGYNLIQEVEMLRHRGLDYAPDVVVVGWCDNDFGPPFFMTKSVDFRRRDVSFLYPLLFNRAEFRQMVDPPAMRSTEVESEFIDPEIADYTGVEGVSKAFSELLEIQRDHGFKLLVFGAMNEHATGICDQLGVAYFNIRSEIPRDKYPSEYGVYFMHPGADGHRALAVELEAALDQRGWLDR